MVDYLRGVIESFPEAITGTLEIPEEYHTLKNQRGTDCDITQLNIQAAVYKQASKA